MVKHTPYGIYEAFVKRFIDFTFSLLAVICFSWLYLIVAISIKAKLGSPVLFKQERPGKEEKIFKLYKFRTMTDEKDEKGEFLPDEIRLTKFGKILRSTSLDELPELINVIKGDMSIIGPRPLLIQYLPYYTEEERCRHNVRPGLTGLSQINGRNYSPWEERFAYDISYVNKITFMRDIKIIFNTVKMVFSRSGVADRSQIHSDENGDLFIIIDGIKQKYPKPLDIERKNKR